MTEKLGVAVGLGEVLWDLLPQGKQLGGAPANFAYMAALLGQQGVVASSAGRDALGDELRRKLGELGLDASLVQLDPSHPTGTVKVHLDDDGQPTYEITEGVAWDFLGWTPHWRELAATAGVICFGSLAQRSTQSRTTIHEFLAAVPKASLRIFDVNLRQQFFSADVLSESLRLANVAKLNDQELPVVMRELGLSFGGEDSSAGASRCAWPIPWERATHSRPRSRTTCSAALRCEPQTKPPTAWGRGWRASREPRLRPTRPY